MIQQYTTYIFVLRLCRIGLPRWSWCLAMSQHKCKAQGQRARQTFSAATCGTRKITGCLGKW